MQTCAVSLSQDPAQLYFSWKKCNKKKQSPRNNPLHVKTNTNICPQRFQKTIKGQGAPDKTGLSFGLRKHHKVLKPRGLTMQQYRTIVYRSPQGGVFEGSLGQAKYMQIGLPLVAHGNPTGIHYTGERNIFSLCGSGFGKCMDFLGRGRNCQFFRIQGRSDFRRGEITNFKQEKREKNHQGLCHLWRCPCDCRHIPAYLPRALGVFH